mmetsp:Transcript_88106/g.205026  ORF Transcript_88106/g.205026 Transcript_88106/m.205026 type:complete len:292 (+) Transcript_88106:113-988(+)
MTTCTRSSCTAPSVCAEAALSPTGRDRPRSARTLWSCGRYRKSGCEASTVAGLSPAASSAIKSSCSRRAQMLWRGWMPRRGRPRAGNHQPKDNREVLTAVTVLLARQQSPTSSGLAATSSATRSNQSRLPARIPWIWGRLRARKHPAKVGSDTSISVSQAASANSAAKTRRSGRAWTPWSQLRRSWRRARGGVDNRLPKRAAEAAGATSATRSSSWSGRAQTAWRGGRCKAGARGKAQTIARPSSRCLRSARVAAGQGAGASTGPARQAARRCMRAARGCPRAGPPAGRAR